jgi:hypothetical protein
MNHFNSAAALNHAAATHSCSNSNNPDQTQPAPFGALPQDDLRRLVAAMVD